MNNKLSTYLNNLTSLPGNNRSILLQNLPKDFFIDLKSFDDSTPISGYDLIKAFIEGHTSIKISDAQSTGINPKIASIFDKAEMIYEERGGKDLYLGWPFIRGKYADNTLVRCPLIFFPLSLKQKEGDWFIERNPEVNITLNKTFLLRYAYHHNMSLDEELIELVLNDFDQDATLFKTQLYEVLKKSGLNIHFNQEIFMEEIQDFPEFSIEEMDQKETAGAIQLYPYGVLGIFPQSGAYLVTDYSKILKDNNHLEMRTFMEQWSKKQVDQHVEERSLYPAFPMNSTQEKALKLIKEGQSLFVNGPPGTGKTQLACGLISDFISSGKNILFVSQKRGALDTAYSRLRSFGFNEFIAKVYDFKNDRKNLYSQVINQIESIDEYRQKNLALDKEQLEKDFIELSEKIQDIKDRLEEFKHALLSNTECGKSIKELYLTSNRKDEHIQLNQIYRNYDFNKVEDFYSRLKKFMEYTREFEAKDNFWSSGASFSKFTQNDLGKIKETVNEIFEFEKELKKESRSFTKNEIDFETALFFHTNKDELELLATNLKNEITYTYYIHMVEHSPSEEASWLSEKERTMLQCFKGPGAETTLESKELGRFQEALEHAIKARKDIFGWIRWRLFSEDKIFITRVLVANELKSNKEGFETLLKKIDNRLNYEHFATEIKSVKWLKDFPDSFRVIDIQNWFFYQKLALKSYYLRHTIRSLPNYILAKNETRKNYIDTIHKLISLINVIPKKLEKWSKYVSQSQVRMLLLKKIKVKEIFDLLDQHFENLIEYHSLNDQFETEEKKIIDQLIDLESQGKGTTENIFINSICLAWIDHIEQKYPILKAASTTEIHELSKDLQQLIDEKIRVCQQMGLTIAREKTYTNQEKGVTDKHSTFSDLYDLLVDPSIKWPLRKVISNYKEEVFTLIPCWMMTPETASALFPQEKVFDLIIFDEASQCLPERAIPVMSRGRTIAILGDQAQLPPIDLYKSDEEKMPQDYSSLIDIVSEHFDEISLHRHYRSNALELIEFSNETFYHQRLKTIPAYPISNEPAIKLIESGGQFENYVNEKEAEDLTNTIINILKNEPEKQIGVITFSNHQRLFIKNLLNQRIHEKKLQITYLPKVKLHLNVQGDEWDTTIISTLYTHESQFNESENIARSINVISTRSRQSIIVFTSIPVNEKLVGDSSLGPLSNFIHYAHSVSNKSWNPILSKPIHSQEWYLKNYILKNAPIKDQFVDELPFADGALKKGNKYTGIIFSDDQLEEEGVKDTFCHLNNLLRERRWPYLQFYSRELWADRAGSLEKLEKFTLREG